ncbi:MAG: DmsC/YnfH family molybdoenzyme membrane anchor subunit [Eggerthellaceae bacterium]
MAAGVAFVTSVAFAYSAETILSWHTVYVPLALWLNALTGGPVLALLGLRAAGFPPVEGRFGRVLLLCSLVALAANVATYGLQAVQLPSIENSFVTAADLVPRYGMMIAAFGVLGAAGIGLDARTLLGGSARQRSEGARPGALACSQVARSATMRAVCASVLVLAGIFVMRFAFYMMHLTAGLGV